MVSEARAAQQINHQNVKFLIELVDEMELIQILILSSRWNHQTLWVSYDRWFFGIVNKQSKLCLT